MKIKPFDALRPAPDKVGRLASVPYDVVDTAEARALAKGNPFSFLRISRPEIDLPDDTDIHSDAVYKHGVDVFQLFQRDGILIREGLPKLYLYRQIMNGRAQTGLVTCCNVADYENNIIRKHEKTRKDKEDDRTRHCLELGANTGPVFLTYRAQEAIDQMVAKVTATTPLYDFIAPDGITHTVWRIDSSSAPWVEAFEKVQLAYIADGHHRAAASARAAQERRKANPAHTGNEEYNWFLAVLFPENQLKILAYNRCVADLNGHTPEAFMKLVEKEFTVKPADNGDVTAPHTCRMYLGGKWYELGWKKPNIGPVDNLDVSVLQSRLLAPVLGIDDPRTSQRIAFIGGIRGTGELTARVDSGRDAVAFSLAPVTVHEMMDIADADEIMPPKSTWFEPKLRSGLLVHTLD